MTELSDVPLDTTGLSRYNDKSSDITNGRKIARVLSKSGCYFPHGRETQSNDTNAPDDDSAPVGMKKGPSLETAWEYFEHIILPRYYDGEVDGEKVKQRAEPGEHEKPTKLYPICGTSDADMSGFGIGVGMYFSTLKFLFVISLIAGLINIPNILYYASDDYHGTDSERKLFGRTGSAVCTNFSWQPCPTCTQADFDVFPRVTDRLAYGTDSNGNELIFIKQSHCNINYRFGIFSYASMIVVILGIYLMFYLQNKKIVSFDEKNDTTADYALEIKNPPNDARQPEEWREFFESNFEDVTVRTCTIALDNEELIKALIRRRSLILQLRNRLLIDDQFDSDDLEDLVKMCPPVPKWKKILCCVSDAKVIYDHILQEESLISELARREYNVASVFVIFETEESQKKVLNALSPPALCAPFIGDRIKFKGVTLDVVQPEEPSAIRWEDLNVPASKRFLEIFITTLVSLVLIVGGASIIALARNNSPELSSLAITIFNQITPRIVRILSSFESHPNESSLSASNYTKMTAFRWVNTAIIYFIISPFTETNQDGQDFLLSSVYTMFYFDLILTPALGLTDIAGNFQRHFLGPKAANQRLMNLNFKAGEYDIGEMYTNVTRVFFFTVFYCVIFPTGYFFAAAIFFFMYWIGKFNILRSYGQAPRVSATVSKFTNKFFLLCVLAYALTSSYFIAQFPFDNTCESETAINDYIEDYTLKTSNGTALDDTSREVTTNDKVYKFCRQDFLRTGVFPPTASKQSEDSKWMNESQEIFSTLYGWTMVVILSIVSATIILYALSKLLKVLFCRGDPGRGAPAEKRFSEVPIISGYIPQVHVNGYQFPFLLSDIDGVNDDLLEWDDPYNTYDFWNLIYDIPQVAETKRKTRKLTTNDAYVNDELKREVSTLESYEISKIVSIVGDWYLS